MHKATAHYFRLPYSVKLMLPLLGLAAFMLTVGIHSGKSQLLFAHDGLVSHPATMRKNKPSSLEAGQRYLIIHADDAGMSHSANRGTIQALEFGLVKSASIMVPCPWFLEFAAYCRQHPEGDYGIHLTLNSEWENYRWGPVASPDQVPSLIDADGYLWDNVGQVAENVRAEEVALELRAQVDRALQQGIPLTHLDTHMGALISRPDLLEVYVQLGIEYDLPVLFVRQSNEELAQQYPHLVQRAEQLIEELDRRGLPVLDHVEQYYGGNSREERMKTYRQSLRDLKPGVTELIIHCGFEDAELSAITDSARRRDGDRRFFTSRATKDLIEQLDIELLTWREFRNRSGRAQANTSE